MLNFSLLFLTLTIGERCRVSVRAAVRPYSRAPFAPLVPFDYFLFSFFTIVSNMVGGCFSISEHAARGSTARPQCFSSDEEKHFLAPGAQVCLRAPMLTTNGRDAEHVRRSSACQ
jgi:hypothetical protein